jgi:hypothetical protein
VKHSASKDSTAARDVDALRGRYRWLMYGIPLGLALLVHARTIGFPFSGLDDGMYFRENPLVTDPGSHSLFELLTTEHIGYPIPITILSYLVDKAFVGIQPWRFHLTNVLLHAANAAWVALLARRLGTSRAAATLAGAWFAVHPLVVEPVSWVTGRKDLLATFFSLLALSFAVGEPRARRWWAAGTSAVAAMLSKPTAATLPAMLWAGMRPRIRRKLLGFVALLFALNLGIGIAGVVAFRKQQPIGAVGASELVGNVIGAWTLSLGHVVWPLDLLPYYFRTSDDPPAWGNVLSLVALAGLVWVAWRYTKRGTPARVGLAWAFWAYVPVAGFLGHNRWTSDSYLYLPLVGVVIAGAAAWERLAARRSAALSFGLGLLAALSLSTLSVAQAEVWRSPERMWRAVSARYTTTPVPLKELAATLQWMGRDAEAMETLVELDRRFESDPRWLVPRAAAQVAAGNPSRAVELLRWGVRSGDPVAARQLLELTLRGLRDPVARSKDDLRRAFELAWPTWSQESDRRSDAALVELLTSLGLETDAERVRRRSSHAQ